MRAIARRVSGFEHAVEVDGHSFTSDEPESEGGTDRGPSPTRLLTASLASCTAITVVMYADRKGWDVGQLEVTTEFHYPVPRGEPARFDVNVRIPTELTDDQLERLRVIAGKCPVHRTLIGEIEIRDRVELVR
jgi:putative redox protein